METIIFGPDKLMKLTEPVDTWLSAGLRDYSVPEALGSSARVFRLEYAPMAGEFVDFPIIKIMRPDKRQYATPLFESEVRILNKMQDVKGITPIMATGFLKTDAGIWPEEIAPLTTSLSQQAAANHMAGSADMYSPGETDNFLNDFQSRIHDEWLAFIVLPFRWEDNLYLRCDAGYSRGEFHRNFPVSLALKTAIQICDMIQAAHDRNIVYLDHKVLHYFWNEPRQQVFVIDWNIGRIVSDQAAADSFEFDVLQFSARALHHLLTGRQAAGSVNVGPNRPDEINSAPHAYEPIWTFDDHKRLTEDEMGVLGKAIQGTYKTPDELAQALTNLYHARQNIS